LVAPERANLPWNLGDLQNDMYVSDTYH
jgi:hypothetical protein